MIYADNREPLPQPITIEDGQSRIILLMQKAYFEGWSRERIVRGLWETIRRVLIGLPLYSLRRDTQRSLFNFAFRVLHTLQTSWLGNGEEARNALAQVNEDYSASRWQEVRKARTGNKPPGYWNAREYIRKRVLPVMDKIAGMQALDPNDYTGRNSLRNLAEMEVRYLNNALSISDFKKSGAKLVVASVHADCSSRCFPWQGRVYSLDGSYGVTDDGRKYVPLETATDVFYTTKAGKTYKNGLLGFNCRHRLLPYIRGVQPEAIGKDTQQKQYAINNRQRAMERNVRVLKLRETLYAGKDVQEYKRIHGEVTRATAVYKAFCKENARAFYPERLQVLKPSTERERERYREIEAARERLKEKEVRNVASK